MVRQMDGRKASLFLASGEEYRPREHESPRGNRIRQPFSLQFEGFSREPLQQGTYDVEHRSLGRFAIFLVPIGVPSTKPTYQAIFG
jgi:hypothetical protein